MKSGESAVKSDMCQVESMRLDLVLSEHEAQRERRRLLVHA